jgi:hypothetical protein
VLELLVKGVLSGAAAERWVGVEESRVQAHICIYKYNWTYDGVTFPVNPLF